MHDVKRDAGAPGRKRIRKCRTWKGTQRRQGAKEYGNAEFDKERQGVDSQ